MLFAGLLPAITVTTCFLFPWLAAFVYPGSKCFQLFLVWRYGKFSKRDLSTGFFSGFLAGVLMCVVPVVLIGFGMLEQLDAEQLRERLQELGVLEHFFLFVLALSIINSALEELYFRCFLFERQKLYFRNWTYLYHGLIFIPHHLVALSKYFDLGWNLLFNFALFIASIIWCVLRDRGMSFLGLWVSHILCDLVVLYYAGSKLLFS